MTSLLQLLPEAHAEEAVKPWANTAICEEKSPQGPICASQGLCLSCVCVPSLCVAICRAAAGRGLGWGVDIFLTAVRGRPAGTPRAPWMATARNWPSATKGHRTSSSPSCPVDGGSWGPSERPSTEQAPDKQGGSKPLCWLEPQSQQDRREKPQPL